MQPEERDPALLWDMYEAASDITEFTKGIPFFKFSSNKMLRYAVERQLVVSGKLLITFLKLSNKLILKFPEKELSVNVMFLPMNMAKF